MNGSTPSSDRSGACCQNDALYQDYLDGALPKTKSLQLFLHLRECEVCRDELGQLEQIYRSLGSMPEVALPEDFNEPVLKAVPYLAYRQMEPLRRDRVPVYLEESFLPARVRAARTRWIGGGIAAISGIGLAFSWFPDVAIIPFVAGILPETLVRLQWVVRRFYQPGRLEVE